MSSGLAEGVRSGDRRALARAITLVESSRPDHREQALELLEELLAGTGGARRVGISGAPGVGKSTFVDAFGSLLVDRGHRVAVLAVDPSSRRSGGSILGDKTRMAELGRRPQAFIRPSPAGATPGGVARRSREALLLCEAAGFDTVLVETVGVGQSETAVAEMVDLFCLLASPGGGDDLQGIKRGVMELAELVVVTKADGELAGAAARAAADYRHALQLMRPVHECWSPRVLSVSARTGGGMGEVAEVIEEHRSALAAAGELEARRARQRRTWLWNELTEGLTERLRSDSQLRRRIEAAEASVVEGKALPTVAAAAILDSLTP